MVVFEMWLGWQVYVVASCEGSAERVCRKHKAIIIGNPKGIQGPPYVYNDKAALDQWVVKAKQEGHKFIAKYKQNKLQSQSSDKYDPGKLACKDKYNTQLLSMY